MNCTLYLVLLGLMGTVFGSPVCPEDCVEAKEYHHPHFQHISDLKRTSVAPWDLTTNITEGREPEMIQYAMCKDCTVEHMIAKPIYIQISVYQMIRRKTWCKCPYDLAVGCTCVHKHQQ